ncbi:uncharacterized protein LOC122255516 [Penaeus japonicus]|uniref:uncharacterized protein LOC122255516 n=1 Tax=Penaeus japonicus TaxID=27405 RepID=UPI001C711EED|nr:uncharacterized protein LOC122255516 [Penaeus japonicus]
MGGEQSRDTGGGGVGVGVGGVEGVDRRGSDPSRPTSTSPRPSICSDSDLPYIPYTVNRPIGDSPKHTSRGGVRGLRAGGGGGSPRRSRRRTQQNLQRPQEVVVVREASANTQGLDPELARLQVSAHPGMRARDVTPTKYIFKVLHVHYTRYKIYCSLYQTHCPIYQIHCPSYQTLDILSIIPDAPTNIPNTPSNIPNTLSIIPDTPNNIPNTPSNIPNTPSNIPNTLSIIPDVDSTISGLVSQVTERQRSFARYAEKLNQVNEISHALSRCHASLNLILESLETLNNSLPIQDRLEPFVWTTG